MIHIGKVVSVVDNEGYDRIKVFIKGVDKDNSVSKLPYCVPLLPKMLQIKPKVGEMVCILPMDDSDMYDSKQRFYIGPIISQKNKMYHEYEDTALNTLNTGRNNTPENRDSNPESAGAYGNDEDVSIYGRESTDILLGDNDIRIRCGAKFIDSPGSADPKAVFNTKNPSFYHLKYHKNPIMVSKKSWDNTKKTWIQGESEPVNSTNSVVAEEINLISTRDIEDEVEISSDGMITDEGMQSVIENSHPMVYGDKLVEYLSMMRDLFINHVHNWGPCPPVLSLSDYQKLMDFDFNDIISKNARMS